MRAPRRLATFILLALAAAVPAGAQFTPYYGKNKVRYDTFRWRVYKSPHFEIYYYPELEPHLARVASYAESAYQKVSSDLKHSIESPIPLVLYKTHSEFEQTNLFPTEVPEGVLAFAEPVRNRMVLPIDEPADRLQGLITHELTHIFQFDIIPRNLLQRDVPQWVDEGHADFERGMWDDLDLMMVRDAAVTDQIPPMSRVEDFSQFASPRVGYNLGHAVFEFIEARWGKEGIRQFLYMFRKNIASGRTKEIYETTFRMKPEEFDKAFERWLKERFKPYRDKQRPDDYGNDLSPNEEQSSFTQVFGFAPAPSGEIVAALSGNRSDQKLDLVILSAKDGSIIKNLTGGYTLRYEDIEFGDDFTAGRSISFAPSGDTVAFFARTHKRRSLLMVSVVTGKIVHQVPLDLDEAESPCLLPDGRHAVFAAHKDGVSDIYLLDLETGKYQNLTNDGFRDSNPQVSPDGSLVVYNRRVSGHEKVYVFPLGDPKKKTQLTFGTFDDLAPIFSVDGKRIHYSSTEDDDILNLRSLDLATGVIKQYTDVLGGNMAPAPLVGKGPERVGFISYYKGKYQFHSIELQEPTREVEQDVQVASDDLLDFEPDVRHQVIPENKRLKGKWERLDFEGKPPLSVGVTSGGDFFGGSQAVLTDVMDDHTFAITVESVRELRSYDFTYLNLSRRVQYAVSAFDNTNFFYASPYNLDQAFSRQGAYATERLTGASVGAIYPFDKFLRLELSAGIVHQSEQFGSSDVQAAVEQQAAALGVPIFLFSGTLAPFTVRLVSETTRFREYGPLSGHTYMLSAEVAPPFANMLGRTTVQGDIRGYQRLFGDVLFAGRVHAFNSTGDNPALFYFGGDSELRGYPYLSFSGNTGFHANLELRLPIIHLMATPIGILGPVRATLFAGVGGAHYKGESYKFATKEPGISYVNDLLFGEPVSGLRLVDGRASYGWGLGINLFGLPLHFDWAKLTDFQVVSQHTEFSFWVGFDY